VHIPPVQGKRKRGAPPVRHKDEKASALNGEKTNPRKRKRDDGGEASEDPYDLTARSLVQQVNCNIVKYGVVLIGRFPVKAWAQAVKVDGTVIVLHSGNYELVCVRHRASNTLYVSDLIEPPTCEDPGYGNFHVGIYMAGIQDAMDRKKQRLQPTTSPDGGGDGSAGGESSKDGQRGNPGVHNEDGRGGGSRGVRGRGNGGRSKGKAGKKDADADESAVLKVRFP
jgi:hypothetical protein